MRAILALVAFLFLLHIVRVVTGASERTAILVVAVGGIATWISWITRERRL